MQIILLNKPFNVLCQFTEPGKRLTLADYITVPGIFAAGRLDYDTEGLIVLTDTGRIQKRITDPASGLSKAYWVQVEGHMDENILVQLANGFQADAGLTGPVSVSQVKPSGIWPRTTPFPKRQQLPTRWLAITMNDDRQQQIRKHTAAVGLTTVRLIRQAVGPWQVGRMQPGEWKVATIPSAWLEPEE